MSADKHNHATVNTDAFAAFRATWGGERCEKMLGSTASARALFNLIYATAEQKLRSLDQSKNHLTRELCADIWPSLKKRQTLCAGMCMAFLARHEVLPIRLHTTPKGKGSKRYWLVPQPAVPVAACAD